MKCVHVHQQFHSVGHGTFLVGVATDEEQGTYRWVYDCGSKRPTRVKTAMETLATWPHWPVDLKIDLLVVSHFDDDHINGLEDLLKRHSVKWLALPYMGIKERLAAVSVVGGGEAASASTALFAIDPLRYLSTRTLADRVEGILLIQGGGEDGTSDGAQPLVDPVGPLEPGDEFDNRIARASLEYRLDMEGGASNVGPKIRVQGHEHAITAGVVPLEFTFFNTAFPEGVANRSKSPIAKVREEVDEILDRFGLLDHAGKVRCGWREQLKRCYARHFGSSGPERNNISLCLMVRPLPSGPKSPCRLFDSPIAIPPASFPKRNTGVRGGAPAEPDTLQSIPVHENRQALLLTGDLALDGDTIRAMKTHFRAWRWREIAVVQVPHHGSRHSWADGNSILFPDPHFVHCAPAVSSQHPHPAVTKDLSASNVATADYSNSVVYRYHFDY